MEKTIKAIVSSLVSLGLFILAVCTCPGEKAHKDKVTATIKKEIQRGADLSKTSEKGPIERGAIQALAELGKLSTPTYVKTHLIVDKFWVFSIGTINDNGPHFCSLGVYNTVFVFPMYMDQIITSLSKE